jgi:hypothetical protein
VYRTQADGSAALAAGVRVSVLGHPEFGWTTTSGNGAYAFAVNADGLLTLDFMNVGTLGAQRGVSAAWHEVLMVPDVQLVSNDDGPGTTVVANAASMQVARGRQVTAAEGVTGPRRATLLIPPGTTSPELAAANWTIHLTEFTVGAAGPRRMPGSLPTLSNYTYAFSATVDGLAAASTVSFNQALPYYVENFPGFPVGTIVPVGSYDETKGVWRGEQNGVVIKVLATGGGTASVDVTGDNVADSGPALTSLGITPAELVQLASLYTAGTTLWRAQLSHFTSYDLNFPARVAAGAGAPNPPPPSGGPPTPDGCETPNAASTVQCSDQSMSEDIAIAGTPYSLHYQSSRTRGYKPVLRVYLNSANPAEPLTAPTQIEWDVSLAGRKFSGVAVGNIPGQYVDIAWDRLDGFGRYVQGETFAYVTITNAYPAIYRSAAGWDAAPSSPDLLGTGDPGSFVRLPTKFRTAIGGVDAAGFALGGASLSDLHLLDVTGETVFFGAGNLRRTDIGYRASKIAGNPLVPLVANPTGLNAANLNLSLTDFAVGADGVTYFSRGGFNNASAPGSVWAFDASGIIANVAGLPPTVPLVDGVLASHAEVYPSRLHATARGELLFSDTNRNQVWRITNESPRRIRLVAGTGVAGDCLAPFNCGDGGAAKLAYLSSPYDVLEAPDGNVFIADYSHGRVRRVNVNGVISTYHLEPQSRNINSLALGADGKMYVRTTAGETIRTLAANGEFLSVLQKTAFCPRPSEYLDTLFVDRQDQLATTCYGYLRGGRDFSVFAGDNSGVAGLVGDGGPALQAKFSQLGRALTLPNGDIIVSDGGGSAIRRISNSGSLGGIGSVYLPEENSDSGYEFNQLGKHCVHAVGSPGPSKQHSAMTHPGALSQLPTAIIYKPPSLATEQVAHSRLPRPTAR